MPPADGMAVFAGQQEIAPSIGSVRQVAARLLCNLRAAGVVEQAPGGGLRLAQPHELGALAGQDAMSMAAHA